MTTKRPDEIDILINEILGLSKPKRRGRKKKPYRGAWALEFYNPERNTSFAMISMCIKEDPYQSIEELALRLSVWKLRPVSECLSVLKKLKKRGKLGYYDKNLRFKKWNGMEAGYGLESLCG